MPTFPSDTKGLLIGSILDNNPVIFIEHRWCHYLNENVKKSFFTERLSDGPKKLSDGKDYTIISSSYGTIEALQATKILKKYKIFVELFDLRVVRPLILSKVFSSVKKTGRLITVDTGFKFLGVGSEIVSQVTEKCFNQLKNPPYRMGFPDHPNPSSRGYLIDVFPNAKNICQKILKDLKINIETKKKIINEAKLLEAEFTDIPNANFKGPF
jgi:pyruvate dehydrogenase E1 component beta subunit